MSKIYAILAAIGAVIVGVFSLLRSGKKVGRNETELEMHQEESRRANERNKIERDVISDGDSVDRLRDKWQRD